MIRVNRDLEAERILEVEKILETEKAKSSGTYNKQEVLDALSEIFNKKCYLCENKNVTSYNIEHLRPHKDKDMDLKFSWDNLFLACAHCNNIKSSKYEKILDCTKIDVDEVISFRKIGHLVWEEKIEIDALKTENEVVGIEETVELLRLIYSGKTPMKKLEAANIKKELRKEIIAFENIINEFMESTGEDKEDAKQSVFKHLKSNSAFAAFKKWIVRDNELELKEFLEAK